LVHEIQLRSEQPADIDAIRRLNEAAFPTPAEARLVDLLREAGRLTLSVVATTEGQIVGHVAFSPITLDGKEFGLGLAPLAVDAAYRRHGIGAAIVEHALANCREMGTPLVVVLGEPHYYSRFGFEPASRHCLVDEYGGGDAFQALWLDPTQLCPSGTVKYAPEFSIFGV
jgi:putative acetyltransferase